MDSRTGTQRTDSNISIPGVQVLSRHINNLTVEVDEPTLYADALTTSREPLPEPAPQSEPLSNGYVSPNHEYSTTNVSSDGSTQSETTGDASREYVRDENGRIPAYIDFAEMGQAFAPLKDAENPLKTA